ncbi:hypothetical protein ACFLZV_06160 [Candidatus Margulisiibacteriota bacterium]
MKKRLIISTIVFFCLAMNCWAGSFGWQGTYNKNSFDFLFPNNPIKQADRINCVKLDKSIRPGSWKEKIPFGICIDKSQNKVFFLNYNSFFKKSILAIKDSDIKKPEDVSVNKYGLIAVADSKANCVFLYQLNNNLKTAILTDKIQVSQPFRCEFLSDTQIVVMTKKNKVFLYKKSKHGYKQNNQASLKLTKELKGRKLADISVSRYRSIYIYMLTDNYLYKANIRGRILKKTKLQHNYTALENSYFGDIFLLNSKINSIDKYNANMRFLDRLDLSKYLKSPANDLAVYDSFGYLVVGAKTQGTYFGLGTDISFLNTEKSKSFSHNNAYRINFKLTFPSLVTISIRDKYNNVKKQLIKKKKLLSGPHTFFWDGKDSENRQLRGLMGVEIVAKARYSLTNIARKQCAINIAFQDKLAK